MNYKHITLALLVALTGQTCQSELIIKEYDQSKDEQALHRIENYCRKSYSLAVKDAYGQSANNFQENEALDTVCYIFNQFNECDIQLKLLRANDKNNYTTLVAYEGEIAIGYIITEKISAKKLTLEQINCLIDQMEIEAQQSTPDALAKMGERLDSVTSGMLAIRSKKSLPDRCMEIKHFTIPLLTKDTESLKLPSYYKKTCKALFLAAIEEIKKKNNVNGIVYKTPASPDLEKILLKVGFSQLESVDTPDGDYHIYLLEI